MVEAWIDPSISWVPGMLLGSIGGGIGGPLAGIFAGRGKFRKLVLGFYYSILLISAGLFIAGIAAFFSGQPYAVWYGLGFPGLLCLIIFSIITGVVLKRYNEAELRKSMASDL